MQSGAWICSAVGLALVSVIGSAAPQTPVTVTLTDLLQRNGAVEVRT
jgi:hypothetical protein